MSPHDEFPPAWKAVMVVAYIAAMGAFSWWMHERFGPWFSGAASGWPSWLNVLFVTALLGVTIPLCFRDVRKHWREKRRQAEEASGVTVLPPPPRPRLP